MEPDSARAYPECAALLVDARTIRWNAPLQPSSGTRARSQPSAAPGGVDRLRVARHSRLRLAVRQRSGAGIVDIAGSGRRAALRGRRGSARALAAPLQRFLPVSTTSHPLAPHALAYAHDHGRGPSPSSFTLTSGRYAMRSELGSARRCRGGHRDPADAQRTCCSSPGRWP